MTLWIEQLMWVSTISDDSLNKIKHQKYTFFWKILVFLMRTMMKRTRLIQAYQVLLVIYNPCKNKEHCWEKILKSSLEMKKLGTMSCHLSILGTGPNIQEQNRYLWMKVLSVNKLHSTDRTFTSSLIAEAVKEKFRYEQMKMWWLHRC